MENVGKNSWIQTLNLNSWEVTEYGGVYFTKDIFGCEIHGNFNCKENQLETLINNAKRVFNNFEELNKIAKELIQKNYPDENVDELKLDDIIFSQDCSFLMGYPTEETDAGHEYIYVKFQKDFTIDDDLIYEYY
ncbi:MAG: hypothetical protein FWH29_10015 [Methanobrevibacter sp.]|nr:hypothetical protein [Methanobrevibacter sp.]